MLTAVLSFFEMYFLGSLLTQKCDSIQKYFRTKFCCSRLVYIPDLNYIKDEMKMEAPLYKH